MGTCAAWNAGSFLQHRSEDPLCALAQWGSCSSRTHCALGHVSRQAGGRARRCTVRREECRRRASRGTAALTVGLGVCGQRCPPHACEGKHGPGPPGASTIYARIPWDNMGTGHGGLIHSCSTYCVPGAGLAAGGAAGNKAKTSDLVGGDRQ